MKKVIVALLMLSVFVTGCSTSQSNETAVGETFLVAAAASMQPSLEELSLLFQEQNPDINMESTYDSSGKLQVQIEEGLEADVFISASTKQMNALDEQGLMDSDSIISLLENKIVLIVPDDSTLDISSFEDILLADKIAIGDPESVPAGQYGKEVLESLDIYDEAIEKASLGTNVTEVLNWVAEGSADVGIVYATDAATTDKVKVVAEAPEGSLEKPVLYPIGIVGNSDNHELSEQYISFLRSEDAKSIFEQYGFVVK
ncbi:MAG: molybdate ABC transporter substrate-binding protein [Lachnospirales bacterium]